MEEERYLKGDRPIGKGGFGEVFKAQDMRTGKNVAMKVLKREVNRFGHEEVQRELIGAQLNHKHIQRVNDISMRKLMIDGEMSDRIVVVSELLPNADLYEMMCDEDGEVSSFPVPQSVARLVMK